MKMFQAWHDDHRVGSPQPTRKKALELLSKHLTAATRGQECEKT